MGMAILLERHSKNRVSQTAVGSGALGSDPVSFVSVLSTDMKAT